MRGAEFAELRAFVAVADARSFRRAAVDLGVSPSALSHSIRELEERLGAKLLNRTTRSVAPTDAGLALLERLGPAFGEIAEAVEEVQALGDRPSGVLRLTVPRAAAHASLGPRLGRFSRACPDVQLEVSVDDGLVDLVKRGFDAGVRPRGRVPRDMVAVRVSEDDRVAVVASPQYLATRPPVRSPKDIRVHACIAYRQIASGTTLRWAFERRGRTVEVTPHGPLIVNDPELMLDAVLQGVGLAYLVASMVSGHLAAGRLVRVLEEWSPSFPGFYLYYPAPGRRQLSPALRVLIGMMQVGGGPVPRSAGAR